jgi:hypothetical protein
VKEEDIRRPSKSCESRWEKMIGKPYIVKPYVRFDEGELKMELLATTPVVRAVIVNEFYKTVKMADK